MEESVSVRTWLSRARSPLRKDDGADDQTEKESNSWHFVPVGHGKERPGGFTTRARLGNGPCQSLTRRSTRETSRDYTQETAPHFMASARHGGSGEVETRALSFVAQIRTASSLASASLSTAERYSSSRPRWRTTASMLSAVSPQ